MVKNKSTRDSFKANLDANGKLVLTNFPEMKKSINQYFRSPISAYGQFYLFGFYMAPLTKVTLTELSTTQTYGSANSAIGAKAFLVAGGAGVVGGGTDPVTITITGTSITKAGVRTASDSETIVADVTALTLNKYVESTKTWIGQITYTIDPGTGADPCTTYTASFNYGFVKCFDFNEKEVEIDNIDINGLAGDADTGFNIEVLKHTNQGWTYSAAAFAPGGSVSVNMGTIYNTENNLVAVEQFAFNKSSIGLKINQYAPRKEGLLVRVTTTVASAVNYMNVNVEYKYKLENE